MPTVGPYRRRSRYPLHAPRELFYWATVMATFALGTPAGDMTASTMGLGYFTSAVLFGILFVLPARSRALSSGRGDGHSCTWLGRTRCTPPSAAVAPI